MLICAIPERANILEFSKNEGSILKVSNFFLLEVVPNGQWRGGHECFDK